MSLTAFGFYQASVFSGPSLRTSILLGLEFLLDGDVFCIFGAVILLSLGQSIEAVASGREQAL
jgi:hypothetical protein